MQIAKHTIVSFDYQLTDDDGQLIDSSEGSEPLSYLHGAGNIIPGLEKELEGKTSGEQLEVSVEPAEAYGHRREELQQVVERERLGDIGELQVGMQLQATTESDQRIVMTIVEMDDSTVTIDGNHPLAGMRLHFDVTIREVREATEEEISRGHA